MNVSKLSQQLVRDMKASAGKTAALGLLLLVGLYFWVPPLLKAFSSETPASPAAPPTVSTSTSATDSSSKKPNSANSPKRPHDSAELVKLLREFPLMQSVQVDELPEKPFGLDEDSIPLPVEIESDLLAEPPPPPPQPKEKPIERLVGLTLKSTLVGPTRRAAMINNRLYHEGQQVPWNDRQLRLESVSRKSVTLSDGLQSWQLTLKDSRGESQE